MTDPEARFPLPHFLLTLSCLLGILFVGASAVADTPRPQLLPTGNTVPMPGTPTEAMQECRKGAMEKSCKEKKEKAKKKAQKIFKEKLKERSDSSAASVRSEKSLMQMILANAGSTTAGSSTSAVLLQSIGLLSPKPEVIVLYDGPSGQAFTKLGSIYAIMLSNLLGHFDADITIKNVNDYTPNEIESFDAAFYLGSYFDNPLPGSFLQDVMATSKTVVWFRYNIWQLAWNAEYNFTGQTGLSFYGLRGMNASPTTEAPAPGFFDTVQYKGVDLVKYYDYDENSGALYADPDAGWMGIVDANKANAEVNILNSVSNEVMPYVSRSGNFWYFADLPLSYIGPRDRYLALCDILHEVLGIDHPESKQAMLRIEDVAALVNPANMKRLTDFLSRRDIPFTITAVPLYRDPAGIYNNGQPQEVFMADSEAMMESLEYAMARGAKISLHGYTHQYREEPNPYSGITGDDFEFWHIPNNAPVVEDSVGWADVRIQQGYAHLLSNGFMPYTWTTPHYQASPSAYAAVNNYFSSRYERSIYYSAISPDLNLPSGDPNRDFAAGQFFPYLIQRDYYGARIYPENLGNIEYDIREIDPASFIDYSWEEVYLNAVYAGVIRDGVGSFFFHPFWLERSLGVDGYTDFRNLVRGISNLGYEWITPDQL
ncbi:DUF2334 domain-containing protein [Microbulbifer guangxiensis]|uniref:DUF2334 domain-containing protein n=1 Tax=Microbulbifer guangxiensis TaxID=2904249 RepID=UPI001F1D14D2|nr:DUF2334 domain-containing protein [Microbulbifer guangxiensis]